MISFVRRIPLIPTPSSNSVIQLLKVIIRRLWGVASVTILACFLLFWFYGGPLAFICLIFGITGILYHAEDLFIYHPTMPSNSRLFVPRPSDHQMPFENIHHVALDGTKIHMYFIRHPDKGSNVPTLVYFHGNAGNMGHRLENAAQLYHLVGVNILMVEYRGYGFSEGVASESGLYIDAQSSIDFLLNRNDINHDKIVVFGRSLGGAVAIDLLSRPEFSDKIWCLIVENTFTNIPKMLQSLLGCRYTRFIPSFFYKYKFMSSAKVRKVTVPCMFICGQSDLLVPPEMGMALHSYCGAEYKLLIKIPSGGHNDTWTCAGYCNVISAFLNDAPPGPAILPPRTVAEV